MNADEALEKVKQAVDRLAKAASHDIAQGADPNEVARQLAEIVEALPGDEKIEHFLTIAKGMSKEGIQQAIAALEAIDEDDNSDEDEADTEAEAKPNTKPKKSPKPKKPKKPKN